MDNSGEETWLLLANIPPTCQERSEASSPNLSSHLRESLTSSDPPFNGDESRTGPSISKPNRHLSISVKTRRRRRHAPVRSLSISIQVM